MNLPLKALKSIDNIFEKDPSFKYQYLIKKIKGSLDNKQDRAVIFTFENSNIKKEIVKSRFKIVLTNAMNHFVSMEEYENAAKCRDILNRIKIEDIIEDSKKV